MREVEAVKTTGQRQQVEAHLADQDIIYADIWKVGVNTALRISDLLSLTMENVRALDPAQPALNVIEQKTGKLRKIVVNQTALDVMQRRLSDNPDHAWLFQTDAVNRDRRAPPKPINRRSVSRVFEQVGQALTIVNNATKELHTMLLSGHWHLNGYVFYSLAGRTKSRTTNLSIYRHYSAEDHH